MVNIVNVTPHAITLLDKDNNIIKVFPPSGDVARCAVTRTQIGAMDFNGNIVPVNSLGFGMVQGLPAPNDGTYYIVSSLVAQAAKGRKDLLTVDDAVRDKDGVIIGCRAFAQTC